MDEEKFKPDADMMNKKMNCTAVIQARMASSRLPGKVLMDLAGQPMLERVIRRVQQASLVDQVIVATTTDPLDDRVVKFCMQRRYAFWRGDQYDVLDRYYRTAEACAADMIVRVTADCPVIDPSLIERAIRVILKKNPLGTCDLVVNRLPPPWRRTYPIGLDVEVCTISALTRAWREADQPHQREHVMPYIYEGISTVESSTTRAVTYYRSPQGFIVAYMNHDPDYGNYRWTVDTEADLKVLEEIYRSFPADDFSWLDILALMRRRPDLAQINAGIRHKSMNDVDERK